MKINRLILCGILGAVLLSGCGTSADDSDFPSQSTGHESTASEGTVSESTASEDSDSEIEVSAEGSSDASAEETITVLLAEPLESAKIRHEEAHFHDFNHYTNGKFKIDYYRAAGIYAREEVRGVMVSDLDLVKDYVELLCSKYSFEMAEESVYLENNDEYRVYFEYVLKYTGEAHVSDTVVPGGTNSAAYGDIVIIGNAYSTNANRSDENRVMSLEIRYAKWLTIVEDGYRYGSDECYGSYVGESFTAGLKLLADGSYQTTDGRLTAALGQAMFITDGVSKTHVSEFEWVHNASQKRLTVKDKFGVPQMALYLPITMPVQSGDIFTVADDMETVDVDTRKGLPNFQTMFTLLHGQDYLLPKDGLAGTMSRFNIRLMYWNEDEAVAVYYFCAQFTSQPKEIEGLVAVPLLDGTEVISSADADYTVKKGESLEITGPSEFDSKYHIWTWEYVSGSNLSELHNTRSKTCTLIAHEAGVVQIRVSYRHTEKEPDVLTGNIRDEADTDTREYSILIRE